MRRLESLVAWRLAREVARDAYNMTLRSPLASHFALCDQVRRAALSVPANICEGYGLATGPQLIRHLRIALGSNAELRSHLQICADLGLADYDAVKDLLARADRLTGVLIGLLKRLGAGAPRR